MVVDIVAVAKRVGREKLRRRRRVRMGGRGRRERRCEVGAMYNCVGAVYEGRGWRW